MSAPASARGRGGACALDTRAVRGRARASLRILVCILSAVPARAGTAVLQAPDPLTLADAYAVRVQLERHEDFRAGWREAPPRLRERALALLLANRDPDAAPWIPPRAAVLAEARYLLGGGTSESYPKLQKVADLLDLRAVPGAFAAGATGKPTPITVRVAPLDYTVPERVNRVKLFWIGPRGRERRVRDEQVLGPALQPPGFDMYIHAPPEAEGAWSLVAEVRASNAWGRSPPVRVEALPAAGLERLRTQDAPFPDAVEPLAVALHDLLRDGVRPPPGFTAAALLGGVGSEADALELPARPWGTFDGSVVWLGHAPARPRRALLLLGSFEVPPEAPLGGLRGAAWAAAAEASSALVLAARSPLGPARLDAIRARLEREHDVDELILVAFRGATADATALRPWRSGSGVDGLVLATAAAPDAKPPRALPLSTLVLHALADEDAVERLAADEQALPSPGTTWVRRRELLLTAELELPRLVAEWLATGAVRPADEGGALQGSEEPR